MACPPLRVCFCNGGHGANAPLPTLQGLRGNIMDIGFIGLGKMGFPMARRLIEAGHRLVVFDQRKEAVDRLVAMGAQGARSPKEAADPPQTVMSSLPAPQPPLQAATRHHDAI